MDTSPLSEFAARPDQSMETHLLGVDEIGKTLTAGAGRTPYGDDWEAVLEAVVWVHDIGKLTEYFQSYMETGDRTVAGDAHLTYHGTFGGLVASVALMERGLSAEATAAGFYAVAKHHSVLGNFHEDIGDYHTSGRAKVDDTYEIASTQLRSIDNTAAKAADVALRQATDDAYGWDELVDDGLGRARATIQRLSELVNDDEWYGSALRTWSTLVTADKMDASGLVANTPARPDISRLTTHLRGLSQTTLPDGEPAAVYLDEPNRPLPDETASMEQRLAAIRTAANARVSEKLRAEYDRGERVFELTLPTGFGKTYTGLRGALTLADEQNSRVIYALPYTSIIDQVDDEVRDVFGLSPQDEAYTKHHHLADTRTSLREQADGRADGPASGRETLHAESWQSGLVLTTFTQLFESAAGPGNIQSTKLPSLQDAVILIDEPQAISMNWWGLIGRLASHLTTEYNATVILMTATQPRIFERLPYAPDPTALTDLTSEATDLIADAPRVTFELHGSLIEHLDSTAAPLSIPSAAHEIQTTTSAGENTLAVVNTVDSAAEMTESLIETGATPLGGELIAYWRDTEDTTFDPGVYLDRVTTANPDADTVVAALSTRQRPRDRIALIQTIDAILDSSTKTPFDSTPMVTVSTQLIEAGVDLSFDRLYRDYSPLPAIVQAAGRCNRRFENDPASVTIWRLAGPEKADYVPSQLIYGDRSLLRPTETAIQKLRETSGTNSLTESAMIGDGVEQYYDSLHDQRRTSARSDELVSAFNEARGETLREASIVSSGYPTKDYLVLINEADIAQHVQYRRQRDNNQWSKARSTFQCLKPTLVSVPISESIETDSPEPIYISDDESVYDVVTGRGLTDAIVRMDGEI